MRVRVDRKLQPVLLRALARPSGAGVEEEVSQWAQQFMLQNPDFPFQPTEPRHLSQQDPMWQGDGSKELFTGQRWPPTHQVPFIRSIKDTWPTEFTQWLQTCYAGEHVTAAGNPGVINSERNYWVSALSLSIPVVCHL